MYTQQQLELLEKVENLKKEKRLSQNAVGQLIGVSGATLSQIKNGNYNADPQKIFKTLENYFEVKEKAKLTYSELNYAPTSISEQICDIIAICHAKGGLSIVTGEAGIGKTKAISKYVADHPTNSFTITMNPCFTGVKTLLSIIAEKIGCECSHSIAQLYNSIKNKLSDGMILIIDEAQHMTLKDIDVVRSFSDYFASINQTFGICFIGNPETVYKMGAKKAGFSQITNRAKQAKIYSTLDVQRSDIEKLFPILADKNMNAEIDFLYHIAQTPQALRGAVNLFSNAYDHENITYEGLVAMAKFMEMEV